jgi:hypothetical protein
MPRYGNGDLRIEVDPQNARGTERHMPDRVGYGEAMAKAGYATLDQADTGNYAAKERRGLARDANHPKRY